MWNGKRTKEEAGDEGEIEGRVGHSGPLLQNSSNFFYPKKQP